VVAVCNATGLKPDIRGMHFPSGSIKDVPRLLSLKRDGGILDNEGVVDVITRVRADGRRIRNNIRWGVFVVVTSDSRDARDFSKHMRLRGVEEAKTRLSIDIFTGLDLRRQYL